MKAISEMYFGLAQDIYSPLSEYVPTYVILSVRNKEQSYE